MIKFKRTYYMMGAAFTAGMIMDTKSAVAAGTNDFSKIAENISVSIASLPGLISGVAYLIGVLIGVLGILKIKDHVENPTQTPLKDGVIRVVAGGGLFALPIVFESMLNTVGEGETVDVAQLQRVKLGLTGAP